MAEETKPEEKTVIAKVKKRPLILSVMCLFSFVYFGVLSLLFFSGLFNSGWITAVMNQYLPVAEYTKAQIMFIFGGGFFLHGLAFAGTLLIWRLRKAGYYFLGISCLSIAALQLLNPLTAIASVALYIILTVLFGLFYNRLQ